MARIVVIDDDSCFRGDLADRLEDWGHTVVQAGDLPHGLFVIENFRPDVVLCDVNMPNGIGFGLFDRLESNSVRHAGMSVIFISSLYEPRAVAYGLDCGAADYIAKPIHNAELKRKIDACIKAKQRSIVAGVGRMLASWLGEAPAPARSSASPKYARSGRLGRT